MSGLAFKNAGPFSMISGEALVPDRFVLISSSTAMYADGGEEPIGLTQEAVATATVVALEPLDGGVHKVTGSKAITAGSDFYVTTDGKVSDAAVGKQIGILLEAITGDGGKAAAIVWGPRGGNDIMSSNMATTFRIQDHFTDGSTEDGCKFSETADKGDWLKTSTDGSAGTADICNVADDGPGGILVLTCNAANADLEELQLNGSSVKLAVGKKVWFEASVALLDVDKCDFFIGLALPDTSVLAGTNDRVGFEQLHDGNIDALTEEGTTENLEDTLANIADCAAIANFAAKKMQLSFFWDGVDSLFFYVDGVLKITMTDNATTILVPDGVVLTPTIGIKTHTGASAVQTVWVDYIEVIAEI